VAAKSWIKKLLLLLISVLTLPSTDGFKHSSSYIWKLTNLKKTSKRFIFQCHPFLRFSFCLQLLQRGLIASTVNINEDTKFRFSRCQRIKENDNKYLRCELYVKTRAVQVVLMHHGKRSAQQPTAADNDDDDDGEWQFSEESLMFSPPDGLAISRGR